jgi:hypothetical protein
MAYWYTQNPIKPFVNKDVILEATCYDLRWQLANCKNSGKKTVTDNGIYTLNYKDFTDTGKSENIEVNWIDKTLPLADTINFSEKNCTKNNVTAYVQYIDGLKVSRDSDRISWFDNSSEQTMPFYKTNYLSKYGDKWKRLMVNYVFSDVWNKTVSITDKAGNESRPKTITVDWIDHSDPTIQNFSINKNGDSTLRIWWTYPIVFTVNDSRPTWCMDQTIFYDIYIQKDGEVVSEQSREWQTTTIWSTVNNNTITFAGNGKYGIFLRIRDTAGNEVSQSLGNINNANIPASVSSSSTTTTNSPWVIMDDILWVKIIGIYQWQWKDQQILAGQEANMTLVQATATRDIIRKNAYVLIRNRSTNDWKIIWWVKYVTWDYAYDDSEIYDTLIVRNGNFTINSNVTKNRWFIILDDDMTGTNGNILVWNDVTDIKWILFGEGKLDGDRTSMKQLRILGSLLTRNTIGGSIFKNWSYILPGNKITNDEAMAKSYDLNLLRGKNDGWDFNGDGVENGNEFKNATLLIRYNPENSTNPPPGFGQ